ncbi:hypothetical protein WME95_31695 [Sorangium sp. So ce327]|jgi:hypothetical protein|uniref:hypothetical protein n=1 Tax=unclassified Sorangium TaxID=2621164 RepID=UPI003F5D69F8
MVTLEQAHQVVQIYAEQFGAVWSERTVIDRGGYWFFGVGYVGSCGVIVDKADGRLSIMGSALSLDDCFWGHEHGFSPDLVRLRINKVNEQGRTIELLLHLVTGGPPRQRNPSLKRAWLADRLRALPCEFGPDRLWLSIPAFREALQQRWFEFDVLEPREELGQVRQ